MAGHDDESVRDAAHCLVVLRREGERLGAGLVGALADEVQLERVVLRALALLVHDAEERFVVREAALRQIVHARFDYRRPRPLIQKLTKGSSLARHEQISLQNIRIAVAAQRHHFDNAVGVPFLCECDDAGCHEFVVARLPDYDRIRRDGLVLVATGHTVAGAALVCEDGDYQVYRVGSPAAAAG